jgi:hypothetical protein
MNGLEWMRAVSRFYWMTLPPRGSHMQSPASIFRKGKKKKKTTPLLALISVTTPDFDIREISRYQVG